MQRFPAGVPRLFISEASSGGPRLYRQPPRVGYAVDSFPRVIKLSSLTSLLLPRRAGGRVRFELTLLAPCALKNNCCLSLHLNSFITACYHYTIFHSGLRGNRTRSGHCLRFYRPACLLYHATNPYLDTLHFRESNPIRKSSSDLLLTIYNNNCCMCLYY